MMQTNEILRKNPTPADQMHCIIFVVRATSNMSAHPPSISLEVMRSIRKLRKAEGKMYLCMTFILHKCAKKNYRLCIPVSSFCYVNGFPLVLKLYKNSTQKVKYTNTISLK